MENEITINPEINPEMKKRLPPYEEYDPEWDYNPGELLTLSVWHKKELSEEAVKKIKAVVDYMLGREENGVPWMLNKAEIDSLLAGYTQCLTIPDGLEVDMITLLRAANTKLKESEG